MKVLKGMNNRSNSCYAREIVNWRCYASQFVDRKIITALTTEDWFACMIELCVNIAWGWDNRPLGRVDG